MKSLKVKYNSPYLPVLMDVFIWKYNKISAGRVLHLLIAWFMCAFITVYIGKTHMILVQNYNSCHRKIDKASTMYITTGILSVCKLSIVRDEVLSFPWAKIYNSCNTVMPVNDFSSLDKAKFDIWKSLIYCIVERKQRQQSRHNIWKYEKVSKVRDL